MNYDLLTKIRSLLISWLIILAFVTVGCQRIQFENVNPQLPFLTFDQNEDISFVNLPLAVQEFHKHPHLPPESQALLLIVTWFPRPYPKFFEVLLLWEDGSISNYKEVPDWAVQGGAGAELTMSELQEMRNLLDKLTGVQTPTTGNGRTVIALKFRDREKEHTLTCTELECLSEIQDLFKLAEHAFKRDAPTYGVMPNPFRNDN